jgi:LEA14-like dessication related protein
MLRRLMIFAAAVAWLAAFTVFAGCSKPKPPTITPRSARVTNVSLQGVDIDADLIVYNPNDIDLAVKGVTATVTLDHKYDVGTFEEKKPVTLPAKKKTIVKMPIKVRWADVMGLADLAMSNKDIDYLVDGSAEVGGDVLRVNLPFSITGTVTHAQIMQAAGKAMPKDLPFPLPF